MERCAERHRWPVAGQVATGAALVAVSVLLSGCGAEQVRVAPRAADEIAGLIGRSSRPVELSGTDLSRLAEGAQVQPDRIRRMAVQQQWLRTWEESLPALSGLSDESKSVVLGLGCDIANGQVTTQEELWTSLVQQVGGLGVPAAKSLYDSALATEQALREDLDGPDPEVRASVQIACFTVQQLQGLD